MLINQAQVNVDEQNVNSEAELLRVENQYWVTMARDLVWLKEQPQFKRVILDGYFKDKAINGVSMLAIDHIKQNGLRGDIMEQLVAISQLEDYFVTIENLGALPSDEDDDSEE